MQCGLLCGCLFIDTCPYDLFSIKLQLLVTVLAAILTTFQLPLCFHEVRHLSLQLNWAAQVVFHFGVSLHLCCPKLVDFLLCEKITALHVLRFNL